MNRTRSPFWLAALAVFTLVVGTVNAIAADRAILGDTLGIPPAAKTDQHTVRTLNELRQHARNNGTARLIIGVRAAFAPEGSMDGKNVARQRRDIANAQSAVLDKVASLKLKPKKTKRFSTIPFMAIEADPTELEELTSLAEITSIEEDKLATPSLAESVPLIEGTTAWDSGYTGTGQTVAILDTGVDKTHPFLAGKVVSEACYSSDYAPDGATSICPGGGTQSTATDSAMPYAGTCPSGECDHGTHVAGIVAGTGASFSGVAKDASLIAIQVFSRFDSATNCGSTTPCAMSYQSDEILGLERVYALHSTYNIAAVNMSLGGGRYYDQNTCDSDNASIKTAIDNLRAVGIATVIAAGNSGYLDSLSEPGCISSAVSVGATWDEAGWFNNCSGYTLGYSSADQIACYSNSAPFLSLLAPGSAITSSIPGGGYAEKHGTSMATPHVAGAWAILKQKNTNLSVSDGLIALSSTGTPVTDPRNRIVKPRIRIDAALGAIASTCHASLSPTSLATGAETTFGNINVTADSGCNWSATSNADWITFTAGTSGNGNGTIAYFVDTNTNASSRTGTVTIAGLTFTVTQAGTADTIPPSVPTGLTATAAGSSQINLSWTASTDIVGVTAYEVYRGGSLIAQVNATSYSDAGLTPSTPYSYTVTACDAAANCSAQSSAAMATTFVLEPDLALTALSTTTAALLPGKTLALSNTVKNQGGSKTGAFTIAFRLSANAVYGDGDDIVLTAKRSVTSLAVGASSTASTTLTVPSTTPARNYYICAQADSANTVNEGVLEDNNTRCTNSPVAVTYSDFIMTAVTPAAATVNQGATLAGSSTVMNQGVVTSGASKVGFRLSLNNVYGDADDIAITATRSVAALAAGAASTGSTTLTVPATTAPNTYYLCAKADSASAVVETDENNNALCSSTLVTVPPPDLLLTALSTTTTAQAPGKTLSLSNTVKNQGGSKAGAFTIAFRLSANAVYGDGDDIVLTAARSLTALATGTSSTAATTLTIPSATPSGNYYLCAKADSGNTVNEGANENNNTACAGTPVAVTYPDLVTTAVTSAAATVNQGATLAVSTTVMNQGLVVSGASKVTFRLSLNNVYGDADDVAITATRSVASLAAGASSTGSTTLTVPATTVPNTYYLCAKADSANTVVETDENNNTLCSATPVTVPPPDLVVSALSTTATTATPGASISVSNSIKNQGGSTAGSSIVAFHLSTNPTYGDGDDVGAPTTRTISSLAITVTSAASTTMKIPSTIAAGTYYVCAQADNANTVTEADESNNAACTATTIMVP